MISSRKPSGASSPPRKERPHRDRGLLHRPLGGQVSRHDDHFPQDAHDEEWLTEVGSRRWCVVTRDDRIRYRRLEAAAVRNAKVAMFVIVSKNLTGPQTAEVILKALGRIRRFISSHRRPFIAKIYRDGRVEKLEFE